MLVIKKRWSTFVQWSIISAVTILVNNIYYILYKFASESTQCNIVCILQIPLIGFDSCYYGKFVLAPWNIVKYNIFSSHGPNLYGTEPWTFYFLNGILNFNIAFVLTFLAPVLLVSWSFLIEGVSKIPSILFNFCCKVLVKIALPEKPRNSACFPYVLSLGGFFLWMLVFGIQPHKVSIGLNHTQTRTGFHYRLFSRRKDSFSPSTR